MCSQVATTEPSPLSAGSIASGGDYGYGRVLGKNGFSSMGAVEIANLARGAHDFLQQIQVPKKSNISFVVDGVPYSASYTPEGEMIHLSIWATLGYLPYSADSADKRRVLINILNGVRSSEGVKFGVNKRQEIMAKADYKIPNIELPTFIFMPLIKFIQQARPVIRLIGEVI